MSIKRSKKSKLIQKSIYFDFVYFFQSFLIHFDLFRFISNFLIKSGSKLINFVTTIDLNSKNLDHEFDQNTIQIRLKLITIPKSIQSPKLTPMCLVFQSI